MRFWFSTDRVEALADELGKLPDSYFEKLGIPRQVLARDLAPFQGRLIFPNSPGYDEARKLSNPIFDLHPALIAYCNGDSDIRICLALLGAFPGVPFRIRAGGHSILGYSEVDDGVVIDVSRLNDVCVHPVQRTVTAGSGTQFEKIYRVLEQLGAHIPGGECLSVAIGGYMQGGGYSLSSRTFGMNSDNVVSFRVMLADGRIVKASPRRHRDLWWAVRGGTGNNFGVLLSVTYRMRRVETVYGWRLHWRLTTDQDRQLAADALVVVQKTFSGTDREFNIQVSVQHRELSPGVGEPQLWVYGAYLGRSQEGRTAIAPLRSLPGAVFEFEHEDTYSKVVDRLTHPYPYFPSHLKGTMPCGVKASRYIGQSGAGSYWTQQNWKKLLDYLVVPADEQWTVFWLEPYGGAIASYPSHKSAFMHREVAFNACIAAFWDKEDQINDDPNGRILRAQSFLDGWRALMQPAWNGNIYQNYLADELGSGTHAAAYWGKALPALIAVKKKYDPKRRFDFPHAIPDGAPVQISWPADVAKALPRTIEPEVATNIWSSRLLTMVRTWFDA